MTKLSPAVERALDTYVSLAGRLAASPRTPTRRAEDERARAKAQLVAAIEACPDCPMPDACLVLMRRGAKSTCERTAAHQEVTRA